MQNPLIPTSELEMLVSEMNDRLDALEIRVVETVEREYVILLNEKQKEIDHIKKQYYRMNEEMNRNRSMAAKKSSILIHPKYSV